MWSVPEAIGVSIDLSPTTSSAAVVSILTFTDESLTAKPVLLATSAVTSNSSPGVAK